MQIRRWLAACAICLGFIVWTIAKSPAIIDSATVNVVELLPVPPAAGSLQGTAEMDAVLRAQETRGEEDVKRIQAENKLTPAAFQPVLGADFSAENFPLTFKLLQDAERDSKAFTSKGKDRFDRPRPFEADSRVRPVVKTSGDRSYPSGHATRGAMWAAILAEVVPERKKALIGRGQEIGWDRVIGGVHYPTDVYAGQVLGTALAREMLKTAVFREQLQNAVREYESKQPAIPGKTPATAKKARAA